MPILYIIAGPNGAGKTTASYSLLPDMLDCNEFVNADEIARGLSPFNPESLAFEAGRIMLKRIDELIESKTTFAFETTLSTRSHVKLIEKCKKSGYEIALIFLWLDSPQLAVERVKSRVIKGGHNIPEIIIRRRYKRGLQNFVNLFMPLCSVWTVFDNSGSTPKLIAEGKYLDTKRIEQKKIWIIILNYGKVKP